MPRNDVEVRIGADNRELNDALDESEARLDSFGKDALQLARNLGRQAAIAAGALGALAVASTKYVSEIGRISRGTGVASDVVQRYSLALRNLGKDQDSVNDLFIDTADRLQELRDNVSTYVDDFALLNLSTEEFVGLDPAGAVERLARAVEESPDEIKALAAAARLLPEFQHILPQLREELEAVSNVTLLSDEEIGRARELDRSINAVASTFQQEFAAEFFAGLDDSELSLENMVRIAGDLGEALGNAASDFVGLLNDATDAYIRARDAVDDFQPEDLQGNNVIALGLAAVVRTTDEILRELGLREDRPSGPQGLGALVPTQLPPSAQQTAQQSLADSINADLEDVDLGQFVGLRQFQADLKQYTEAQEEAAQRESDIVNLRRQLAIEFSEVLDEEEQGARRRAQNLFDLRVAERELSERQEEEAREATLEAAESVFDFWVQGIQQGADSEDIIKAAALRLVSNFLQQLSAGEGFSLPGLLSFHEGGIVPGRPGQEVPILAQAGERVIPAGEGSGGVTINNETTLIGDVGRSMIEATGVYGDAMVGNLIGALDRAGYARMR